MSTLAEESLEYIRRHPTTSFAELERFLAGHGMETSGSMCIEILPNLILWAGMSDEFVDLVYELQPHVELTPTSLLVYLSDGKALTLPIAKRPPKNGYVDPHWAPAVMSVKEVASAS